MKLSATMIVYNEEANIADCLKSLNFCDEIIVVDGESQDNTAQIARSLNAKVYARPFQNYADQKNFAVEQAKGEWILSVDADERVSEALREEILKRIQTADAKAYRLKRQNIIFGKNFKHGDSANDTPIRLFRKGTAKFSGIVHESLNIEGPLVTLSNPLTHFSTRTIKTYMRKLNAYTTLEETQFLMRGKKVTGRDLWLRPPARFLYIYLWRRGFLDGLESFIFVFLSAYYEFVKYAKFWEKTSGSKSENR